MKKLYIALILIVLLSFGVIGGTLISASDVKIVSNYEGFSGLNLLVTWSTTPATSDQLLIIDNSTVSGDHYVTHATGVTILAPTFEQVFSIENQKPLYRALYVEEGFFYTPFIGDEEEKCRSDWESWLSENYPGKTYYPGTLPIAYIGGTYCRVVAVLVDKHEGWIGDVTFAGWNYQQDVLFPGGQKLHIEKTLTNEKLVDKIDGFAKLTLLNFGDWVNARLTDKNIYAYHVASGELTGDWRVFEDSLGYSNYVSLQNKLVSNVNSFNDYEIQQTVNEINQEVSRIKSVTGSYPSSWYGKYTDIRTETNYVIVSLSENVLTANLQLLLSGDAIGLYVRVGKPSIVYVDDSVSFKETENGYLNYKIKNIGETVGTFEITGDCGSDLISVLPGRESDVAVNEVRSGRLTLSAKFDKIDKSMSFNCVLRVREANSGEEVTSSFKVNVEAKASCSSGQVVLVDSQTINILDEFCNVIDVKKCTGNTYFVNENGKWICKEVESGYVPPSPSVPTFNKYLFYITVFLSLVSSAFVYRKLDFVKKSYGNLIRLIIVFGVGVLVFIMFPLIVKSIIDLFSF